LMRWVNGARNLATPRKGGEFMRRRKLNSVRSASVKLIVIACAFLFFGCGSSSDPVPNDGITPAQDIGELSALEKTIYTESYAGYLVVHLNPEVRDQKSEVIKSVRAELVEAPNGVIEIPTVLQPALANHPTVVLKRSVSIAPEQMDARRRYLEAISGKQLADFNLIYHVEVADPDEAVRTMRELSGTADADKIYPGRKAYVASLATTPDLTGQQNYLYSNESYGGLNAQAVWTAGASGAGIMIVDMENDWNYGHEDLDIDWGVDSWGGSSCYPTPATWCEGNMAHGTAVVGILAAQDNGHGTTGFAYQADVKTHGVSAEIVGRLPDGTSPDGEIPPGSVIVVEAQHAGRLSGGLCSGTTEVEQYGCVSVEVQPEYFAAFEYLTAAGITIVDATGNGSVDLSDSATYWPYEVTLFDHDSGSILIGGSQGSNHQKISFSNYGTPVDAYAWAQGVVTTAYPFGDSSGPYYWTPGTGSNPPNDDPNAYYTNRFGGTSSATAIVGGAAALLQSYAKNVMGETTRYLMPLKMREILTSTGVVQSGGGGNIGKQPRLDRAISAVDTFWSTVSTSYPELASSGRLTVTEMIALRALGVGLICIDFDPTNSDPACPDDALFVPGTRIADTLDFDGDRRADLVSWTNGQWKVDLSSVGSGGDNYGSWDLILNYPPTDGRWVWPYVEDFNSDGREDFAVYDKEHGKWYITFTDSTLLGTGTWSGWDWEIDYGSEWVDTLEMDPWDSNYSRPAPGDYDNDGWMDIAIACSDGYWRIDYGGSDRTDYGTFDQNFQYLSPARLTAAPGWAYLTTPTKHSWTNTTLLSYKIPDTLSEEGRLISHRASNPTLDYDVGTPHIFGGNHYVPLPYNKGRTTNLMGLKNSGTWSIATLNTDGSVTLESNPPQGKEIWGILECKPIIADFDGDGIDDRAVMCPDEWRIEYTGSAFYKDSDSIRRVALGYNTAKWALPGRSYSGGVNYSYVQRVIEYYQEIHPTIPPPIPVDMVSVSTCSIPVEDPDGDCR